MLTKQMLIEAAELCDSHESVSGTYAVIERIAKEPGAAEAVGHFLADCTNHTAMLNKDEAVIGLLLAAEAV